MTREYIMTADDGRGTQLVIAQDGADALIVARRCLGALPWRVVGIVPERRRPTYHDSATVERAQRAEDRLKEED